jgi:hypothetical protein
MAFPIAARFAHPDAGYEGDQRQAAEHLEPGKTYVVTHLEVGRSSSELYLDVDGAENIGFNAVMFEAASVYDVDGAIGPDDDEPEDDRLHAFTRDELADALTRLEIRIQLTGPAARKVNAESMADAIIKALEEADHG